jgi:hypothetical protein
MTEILQNDGGSQQFSMFFNHFSKKLSSFCHKKTPPEYLQRGFYFGILGLLNLR